MKILTLFNVQLALYRLVVLLLAAFPSAEPRSADVG
jgi:hypothetical protein